MKVGKCRGFRDLSPDEAERLRQVSSTMEDTCRQWGFQEIKTPTLEYLYLFTSAGTLTPSRLDRVYSFLDWDGWSGERVVLRPDGTIPAARYYIEQGVYPFPVRLFYISNTFMFEETGEKPRESWQGGVEIIGTGGVAVDVELILLAQEIVQALNLGVIEVRLSHVGLLRAILAQTRYTPEEQGLLLDRVLDGDAAAMDEIVSALPGGLSSLGVLAGVNGKSSGFLKNTRALLPPESEEVVKAMDDFIAVSELLETLGCNYQIDLSSARGFEYYTGITFRLFREGLSIGGGGRYDALISLLGRGQTPAAGFALYLDHVVSLYKKESESQKRVLVCFEPPKSVEAFELGKVLRHEGYIATMSPGLYPETGYDFRIEINAEPPLFSLTSSQGSEQLRFNSREGILLALKEAQYGG